MSSFDSNSLSTDSFDTNSFDIEAAVGGGGEAGGGVGPLVATSSSNVITVSHPSHGMSTGDVIIISGASSVGGISEKVLNNQHVITVVSSDVYTITIPDTANASEVGGGSTVSVLKPSYLYSHNIGYDDDGEAMPAFIESGDLDIGEGDRYWFITRILPDIRLVDSSDSSDSATISLIGHSYPADTQVTMATGTVTGTTRQIDVRVRTRQIVYRIESSGLGYGWHVGKTRIDARTDGKR